MSFGASLQDQLIPNSAWKDYSSNTNYAFDAFGETVEEKNGKSRSRTSSSQQTLPMSHSPAKTQYYDNSRNGTNSRHQNGVGGNESRYVEHIISTLPCYRIKILNNYIK